MEALKKYLPFIIIGIVGIYLIRKLGSQRPTILPQTNFQEVPYSDPLNQLRLPAFQSLTELAGIQVQADTRAKEIASEKELGRYTIDVASQRQYNEFVLGERSLINQLQTQLRQFDLLEILGLKSEETEIAKTGLQTELAKYLQTSRDQSILRQLELQLQQREQDRQLQQGAIDRYYSSRNTGQIIGSISQALSGIFGGGNRGSVFGTPPTFPGGGFNFGGFGF